MPLFVLDTNFFIQAHADSYPLDVATTFWEKIKEISHAGHIISIDKVQNELYSYNGTLKKWCIDNLPTGFFHGTKGVLGEYAALINWAQSKNGHYLEQAINEFMSATIADAWLISFAKANNLKLVTYEKAKPLQRKKIQIPDACAPFSVTCINTVNMFRELGISF